MVDEKQQAEERTVLRLMITMATSYQGGHSQTGGEVADILGIPFPLTMKNLSMAAKERGFDPDELWPWLKKMREMPQQAPHSTARGSAK